MKTIQAAKRLEMCISIIVGHEIDCSHVIVKQLLKLSIPTIIYNFDDLYSRSQSCIKMKSRATDSLVHNYNLQEEIKLHLIFCIVHIGSCLLLLVMLFFLVD